MKRLLIFLLVLACLLTGCGYDEVAVTTVEPEVEAPKVSEPLPEVAVVSEQTGDYGLSVAVLYDDGQRWQDIYDLLEQSVLIGMDVVTVDVKNGYDLSGYDLVIPDGALVDSAYMEQLSKDLIDFTKQGGYVLLDNGFSQVMPQDYLGISGTSKLEACPLDASFPELGADLTAIQEVVEDYVNLYPEFYEAETLLGRDYGYGFTTDTAVALAVLGEQALYTWNSYGEGGVMLTNPLLPNCFSLGNFSMTHREEGETAFASTTAACNQLLYSRFAGYVAKQRYGYALNRVFGYNGSPSMAWELHYEEITAFANNSMKLFDDICREYQQIPSYTIIRSSYWWFLRTETVTYLLNQGDGTFQMDFDESAYSSGTHMESNGEWLHLGSIEDGGSYFRDYPEHNFRAYPCFGDVDNDGEAELLSGSQDGCIYVYDDLTYTDRLHVSQARRLTDETGIALDVGTFSAPQVCDVDGDGVSDVLSGAADGTIRWYRGTDQGFAPQGVLLYTDIPGQTLPVLGHVDDDGILDLVVGSDQGILLVYYGQDGEAMRFGWQKMDNYTKLCTNAGFGKWLAPAFRGDKLVVGTFDGYIADLSGAYLDIEERNYKGNHHVKFGNYCVPCFYDLDGDGAEDLVCGSLEYGLAYPIDSEYFPYRAELQAQFDYARRNHQYVGVHHYSNGFASAEREAYELRRHREAFASYGAEFEGLGANAHTWYMSVLGDTQTLDGEYAAGIRWNSGFSAPGDTGVAPQYAAENVIALPFFLQTAGEDTILVQNCSVLPYADPAWTDISAKYHMPVCVYYHCDFVYENDAGPRDYVKKVSDFQYQHGYNFVREDQLMYASAAAYNLDVLVEQENDRLLLTPMERSVEGPLYDKTAQSAVGMEIAFAEDRDAGLYQTNAKVWHRQGNSLFVRLGEPVSVSRRETESPLRQVNLPADITVLDNGAEITFLEDGMMQVITPKGYTADTNTVGWTVTEREDCTVFTKYGSADTLQIRRIG